MANIEVILGVENKMETTIVYWGLGLVKIMCFL